MLIISRELLNLNVILIENFECEKILLAKNEQNSSSKQQFRISLKLLAKFDN